jgi:hypothetical protein
MMFHPYAPWLDWYAPPMQYESFYPRSAEHELNAFDRSAHPRKRSLLSKESVKCSKNSGTAKSNVSIWESGSSSFPSSSWSHKTEKCYHAKQKANSNEGLNLNTQDEKSIFSNDKKQQQSANINSSARTGRKRIIPKSGS